MIRPTTVLGFLASLSAVSAIGETAGASNPMTRNGIANGANMVSDVTNTPSDGADATRETANAFHDTFAGSARVIGRAAQQAAERMQRTLCRSAEHYGKCAESCVDNSSPITGDLIKGCEGSAVCCKTDFLTLDELEAAERDGTDTTSDEYDPGWVDGSDVRKFSAGGGGSSAVMNGINGIQDLLRRNQPGASGDEPCWGNLVPEPCGQAYYRGQPRGQKMCVKEGPKNSLVTIDTYCEYKRLKEAAIAATGLPFVLNSGFRTNAEQTALRRQNCGSNMRPPCHPDTATPGWSRHQNGIAFDIAVAAYPALFRWLRDNATKYGFIRTVGSENWHWEYRPGQKCNSVVRYTCQSPPFLAVSCDGADVPGSETAGLVCREQKHCHAGHISNACRGTTYCCKPVPCTDGSGRNCVMQNEAEFGVDSGLCPGSLYCPKPPRQCDGDSSRICRSPDACALYGSESGLCGTGSLTCCITEPPQCRRDPSRTCQAPSHRNCELYENDAGQCPGTSTCCRTSAKCKNELSQYDCVDPRDPIPMGMKHQSGYCPASSVCLVPTGGASEETNTNPGVPDVETEEEVQVEEQVQEQEQEQQQAEEANGAVRCDHDASRLCRATTHRDCQLYKNEVGHCPGRTTCCNTSAKCSGRYSSHNCVDPNMPVPAGMRHQSGHCPGQSICLVPN